VKVLSKFEKRVKEIKSGSAIKIERKIKKD